MTFTFRKFLFHFLSALPLFPFTATAYNHKDFSTLDWLHPMISLSAGDAFAHVSSPLSFDFNLYAYNLTPKNGYRSAPMWGGFLGTEIPFADALHFDLGVGYYQFSNLLAQGTMTETTAGSTQSFLYSYYVRSIQLLAEAKLMVIIADRVIPYIWGGVGATLNRTYSFQTTDPSLVTTPDFSNYNNTDFSYGVGGGLDFDLSSRWRFGFGYRYACLGKANLGDGSINRTTIDQSPTQSNLCANEVLGQLAYFFNYDGS